MYPTVQSRRGGVELPVASCLRETCHSVIWILIRIAHGNHKLRAAFFFGAKYDQKSRWWLGERPESHFIFCTVSIHLPRSISNTVAQCGTAEAEYRGRQECSTAKSVAKRDAQCFVPMWKKRVLPRSTYGLSGYQTVRIRVFRSRRSSGHTRCSSNDFGKHSSPCSQIQYSFFRNNFLKLVLRFPPRHAFRQCLKIRYIILRSQPAVPL